MAQSIYLSNPGALIFVIDGGGSTIVTGIAGFLPVNFAGTITGWTVLSIDASVTTGAIVVDVWKDTYANYPPTDSDSITGATPPTITATNDTGQSTSVADWTTAFASGDVFGFNVDSVTSLTKVVVALQYTRG